MTSEPPDIAQAPQLEISGEFEHIVRLAEPLERLANAAGIYNVFDDGGYRTLVILTMFGLNKAQAGRLGDDAVDRHGHRYELKTINLINTKGETRRTYPGVTTEHTLTQRNIDRYRQTEAWLIGIFSGNHPLEVWQVPTLSLEPYFATWEERLRVVSALNNPKIPFAHVARVGIRHMVASSDDISRPVPGSYRPPGLRRSSTAPANLAERPASHGYETGARRTSKIQEGDGGGRQLSLLD